MPPLLFTDLDQIDTSRLTAGPAEIEAVNPQRGEMRHLDGVFTMDNESGIAVGYKDVRDDEFWVEGHIPGRPLLPGVLMIEAAAQLCAWMSHRRKGDTGFVGFIGCDKAKFRGQVVPGQRMLLIGKEIQCKPRRYICDIQGVVEGAMVFEARITGMLI